MNKDKSIRLEYDPEGEVLLLRDVNKEVVRTPLIAAYLRQNNAYIDRDGFLAIPTSPDALTIRYQGLSKIFDRAGITLATGEAVSDVLSAVEDEAERFREFSERAEEIWNAKIDTEAFQQFVNVVDKECPGRTFYRKQLLSAHHLAFSRNACNFSVPGAGKTSVVYAAYAYLKSLPATDRHHVERLLVVGPLSSFKAWEDEYREIFERPPLAKRISGAVPPGDRADYLRGISVDAEAVELTLTSYATLANSEDSFATFLRRGPATMMVMDEAHNIKSEDGSQAMAALRLAPLASARVVLTGTPAPNGYEDLANLFKFIYPSRNLIGFPAGSLRAMTDGTLTSAIPELKARVKPFYTRIRKIDLNLPDVHEYRLWIPMSETQERIYRSLERRIVPYLRDAVEGGEDVVRVRARLIRLRQASTNPELLLKPLASEGIFDAEPSELTAAELEIGDLVKSFVPESDLPRLEQCLSLVRDVLQEEGKVLVWSYFLGNLERLRLSCLTLAPFVEVLTGSVPVAGLDEDDEAPWGTREDIIDRFHAEAGKAILIANPQAVGESISLHKACRSAIYFDRDFNAGRFIQSKDRIHRYRPSKGMPVSYYYLNSEGTIDTDIDSRLGVKEARLYDLVDAEDIPLLTAVDDDDALADIRAVLDSYDRRKTR